MVRGILCTNASLVEEATQSSSYNYRRRAWASAYRAARRVLIIERTRNGGRARHVSCSTTRHVGCLHFAHTCSPVLLTR